ncbi:hypothetical protein [Neobacillus massiliamazoniensis]|uniref:Uncharacterized protein n=1 Tax=Neobacillus massiliamazoniensis TaxID=1499688 RepID=A0A0U1NXA2_9BACI|nr:hypothetical protein [Neobacillus massiliamazoniensis]CRK82644.1 hypothetical protein BN000_02577 [Neobacillus massiliamazoniensis]
MPEPGWKRGKRSLIGVVNDRNRLEKRKKVIDRGCQRPKPVGKEEKDS